LRVLNLGAGVQSTTVALMGVENWHYWHCCEPLPFEPVGLIDYAIFADTQEEPRAVYSHLEWLRAKCAKFFPILVRTAGKLGDDLIKGIPLRNKGPVFEVTRFVSIPAFLARVQGQKDGIVPRHCTSDYKVNVIERTIRREILGLAPGQRIPKDSPVTQMLGLSYDEAGRIARVKGRQTEIWRFEFPLFEMEMTRGGCKTWLAKQKIPHEVPRSACVFCPYHTNSEWRAIKSVPEDWERALRIDEAIRPGRRVSAYVHKDCVPLVEADLDDSQTKEAKRGQEMFGFLQECEGHCGV